MWKLSAFADEISPGLSEQITTLVREGIHLVDLRSVAGTNVVDMDALAMETVQTALERQGLQVACVASPIGKVEVHEDFDGHMGRFSQALAAARTLGARYVRIFSFYIPKGEAPSRYREEVLRRLQHMVTLAEEANIVLLHENEKRIYGDLPERCLDLLQSIGSPNLRMAWDPANFIQCGVSQPFSAGFAALRPYIAYVHVKDAKSNGSVVPAGQGYGQWPETIAALQRSNFDGVFAIEPHLKSASDFGGFTGPERFAQAAAAFTGLLRDAGIPWS